MKIMDSEVFKKKLFRVFSTARQCMFCWQKSPGELPRFLQPINPGILKLAGV